jgi:LmbE family N-acetylglucosaminyl deacetylase
MKTRRNTIAAALIALAVALGSAGNEFSPPPSQEGLSGLALALRQLDNVGTFLQVTAHPDDENNAVLAMLTRGKGVRAILATATRGEGGQNEIGPELFKALSVLRTEELLAAHRLDGAEQYFARAVDFGYSFSVEETFERWGRREIVGDYVRFIRELRPDVIVAMRPDGEGGGQHHQATARIAAEAFRAAADPAQFPEQIREGLRPWQAKKLYHTVSYGFAGEPAVRSEGPVLAVDAAVYDPMLGRTYTEIGSRARSMHRCQGMSQLIALPGPAVVRYRLADTSIPGQAQKSESWFFDGIDTRLVGLARFGSGPVSERLGARLADITEQVALARRQLDSGGTHTAAAPIARGMTMLRQLRQELPRLGLDDDAVFEVDHRLRTKEQQFQDALLLAHAIRVETLADDLLIVPGQALKSIVIVANRGDIDVKVESITFAGLRGGECEPGTVGAGSAYRCETELKVAEDAALTKPYWEQIPGMDRYELDPAVPFGLPFRPTPYRAQLTLGLYGVSLALEQPLQHRYEGEIAGGEKRSVLKVVPDFSVRVSPDIAIIPVGGRTGVSDGSTSGQASSASREIRVNIVNGTKGPASGEARLRAPEGWRVTPEAAPVRFVREDEAQAVRFEVTPPAGVAPGEYRLRATVRVDGRDFDQGYQVVEYPHTDRRHLYHPAQTVLKVVDVQMPRLTVGYIKGVGDQVPAAIEQLGARLEMIGPDELAWGDLSRFDAIVTGVRAYERRDDLRAHNHRLIDYAERGGTVIVQYNKFEFNQAQYGPFPARVSSQRVTDEGAPVDLLVPDHPVFNWPNRIGEETWHGWVQERGLYFLGERDTRYRDLLQLTEPFEYNKGVKRGALVEARVGDGRWIYLGLGLWRQLPAGTDGAYRLMANLLSLGKAPAGE